MELIFHVSVVSLSLLNKTDILRRNIISFECFLSLTSVNFGLLSNTWMGTGTYGYLWTIQDFLNALPKSSNVHPNWVLGNHDNKRIASKYKPSRIDLYNILLKTLPGK